MASRYSEERLQRAIDDIRHLLERHRLLDTLAQRQEGPRRDLVEHLQRRQNLAELHRHVRAMHPADLAAVIEALPPGDRQTVWEQMDAGQAGQVLLELGPSVRASILDVTPRDMLIARLLTLDPEDLAFIADALDPDMQDAVARRLEASDRAAFDQSAQYGDATVGRYMSREWVALPDTLTIQDALDHLRARQALPPQTDRVFVVDARNVLRGTVPLPALLQTPPATPLAGVVTTEAAVFDPRERVEVAATAFERYDLVSAPVVDDRGKLVGRLTVDAVMDFVREAANMRTLKGAGLSGDEDLFGGPWQSARNRWPWLAVNLVTAFVASRVIGRFEGEIQALAPLAALMPIVASIGGNTGNQTMALVVRGLALDRIRPDAARQVFRKELGISLLTGAVWGTIVGLAAALLYADWQLGLVMSGAVILNLVVAALAGVGVPFGLEATGRDPAHGASVLLTFITDAMGFFLFLGLASLFLV